MAKAGLVFQKKDEYMTPKEVIDFFGPFDYDPATTKEQAETLGILNYDTILSDGLKTDWSQYDKIWINPPFTRKFEFLEKAVKTDSHIFFLMPIETMTTGKFHDIMRHYRGGYIMWLPNSRIKFEDGSGKSSFPAFGSIVLEFCGKRKRIKHWRLNGKDS